MYFPGENLRDDARVYRHVCVGTCACVWACARVCGSMCVFCDSATAFDILQINWHFLLTILLKLSLIQSRFVISLSPVYFRLNICVLKIHTN